MGAVIDEGEDSLVIQQATLYGAEVDSHQDHRIAMSLAIAALATQGTTVINNVRCVEKSYQRFADDLLQLGGNLQMQ